MLLYITHAVLVLIVIFMVISASVTSPFGNRKLKLAIGIVIATATVIALSIGGYTQYKYDTASVEKADNIEIIDKKSHDYRLEKDNRKIQRQKIQFV